VLATRVQRLRTAVLHGREVLLLVRDTKVA